MTGRSWWVAGASVLLLVSSAVAQTVYTWKDDKGVVHFADESPEGVKNVEKLTLDVPAPLVSEDTGDEGGAPGGESGEKIAVTPAAGGGQPPAGQFSGPAEVIFLGAELFANSSTERKVIGKLRNTGGDPAHKISVRVVIADGDTGNLCTTGELDGEPRDLGPGDTGGFQGLLNTPCFLGNPKITYYPEWD
jgi:hypothetical protein